MKFELFFSFGSKALSTLNHMHQHECINDVATTYDEF